jgi:hypothetical protein
MPGDNSREDFAAAIAELEAGGDTADRDTSIADTDPAGGTGAAEEAPAAPARERDASGKFAPRTPAQESVPADKEPVKEDATPTVETTPSITPAPKPDDLRAPASWKPEEREHWATISPAARAAVIRREREMDAALATTADARRLQQDFQRVTSPYEAFFRAENSTAIQAVESLMQTAAALRTAPPGHKAGLVAELISTYGIDVQMLDNILSAKMQGRPAPGHPADPIVGMIQKELAPMKEFMGKFKQGQQVSQQQVEQQAEQAWNAFAADPANEFANDVRDDMADLLEVAAKRGVTLSLQDAYKRATLLHPTISNVVESRKQASGAAQQTAAARRAAKAAASLPSNGGAPAQDDKDEGDGSVRGDIAASIRQLSASR